MAAASGLRTSQLLVMKGAPVYAAETGVLAGMLGGDVVEEAEAEVIGGFAWDEVELDLVEGSLWEPRKGHSPERDRCDSD